MMPKKDKHWVRWMGILAMLLLVSCVAGAQDPAETGAMNKAFESCAAGEYRQAATVLEEILPRTRNEEIFWKLCEIYDSNLHDYDRASVTYQKYLGLFPEGRFAGDFKSRLAYLGEHRGEWDVMARYKTILDTYNTRPRGENIKMMRQLLADRPSTSLTPDIYSWLAWEYYQNKQTELAIQYIKKVLADFPSISASNNKLIEVYQTYSMVLAEARHYGEAIRVVRESSKYGVDPTIFVGTIAVLKKERLLWWGFVFSLILVALTIVAVIFLRPWKEEGFKARWPLVLYATGAMIVCTLIFTWIVQRRGYGLYKSHLSLGILGGVDLVLIKMLTPIARRKSRTVYMTAAVVLTLATVYITYYFWDNLCVFYQMPDFNG